MDDVMITSTEAARKLGISRQAITTPAMDVILRPIKKGRRRWYSLAAIERYGARRAVEELG
jgi:hypothetical protein